MAVKVLTIGPTGLQTEVEAKTSSAGAADAGKLMAPGSDGRFDLSLMPVGIGPSTKTFLASEALSGPCLVNIWQDAAVAKVRLADSTAANGSKQADGFVQASVTSGANATVYFEGELTGLSGLTPGARQFLGPTGTRVETAPTTAGHSMQVVGVATSATSMDFEKAPPIIRA